MTVLLWTCLCIYVFVLRVRTDLATGKPPAEVPYCQCGVHATHTNCFISNRCPLRITTCSHIYLFLLKAMSVPSAWQITPRLRDFWCRFDFRLRRKCFHFLYCAHVNCKQVTFVNLDVRLCFIKCLHISWFFLLLLMTYNISGNGKRLLTFRVLNLMSFQVGDPV
jgi:hypothetical protein